MRKIVTVIAGTRGEFIKLVPVMSELKNMGITVNLVCTMQHAAAAEEMAALFGMQKPNFFTHQNKSDFTRFLDLAWFFSRLPFSLLKIKKIFPQKRGLVLLHGDTSSTLYGLLLSKIAGQKVAHLEAGLRSSDFFDPFPEEIIRTITSMFSDYLFCPGQWACKNLKNYKGEIIDIGGNTVFDSMRQMLKNSQPVFTGKYALALCHRTENIYKKGRMEFFVDILEKTSGNMKVFLVLHRPTEKKLKDFGLLERLRENENIVISEYVGYDRMVSLIRNSEFVVSDGGGLQEEAYFLEKPIFILRSRTERPYGLGHTAFLSNFEEKKFDWFFGNYKKFVRKEKQCEAYPSRIVAGKISLILEGKSN